MRLLLMFKHFRLAAILLAGAASTQAAMASEIPTKAGHVRYTTGTAAVRSEQVGQRLQVYTEAATSRDAGQWQVASVDASAVAGQTSMTEIKPATFELPSAMTFGSGVVAPAHGPAMLNAEATRNKEPGFWAPALSTLALALFFYLRRLA